MNNFPGCFCLDFLISKQMCGVIFIIVYSLIILIYILNNNRYIISTSEG